MKQCSNYFQDPLLLSGDGDRKVLSLVGKGLTFDSGGYNLKVGGEHLAFLALNKNSLTGHLPMDKSSMHYKQN